MATKQNVLLVHGAWVDASSWSGVIPHLLEAGFNVLAVQLPLTSLEDDIAVTKAALASLDGPTVLAGHSYGGVVVSGAASEAANVTGLVYIAAYVLDEGETVFDINNKFPPTEGVAYIRPSYLPNSIWIDPAAFPRFFVPDVDQMQGQVLAIVQKPQALKGGSITNPAWKHRPSWYLISDDDQIINPLAQHWMAERIGAKVQTISSSHASPVSHPREVAETIMTAVRATTGD